MKTDIVQESLQGNVKDIFHIGLLDSKLVTLDRFKGHKKANVYRTMSILHYSMWPILKRYKIFVGKDSW